MTEEQKNYDTKELKIIDKRVKFDEIQSLPAAPNDVIMMAMQKGYTPEFIEKMMSLSERNEANEARRAYYQAIADFKRNPPEVLKDKENSQFSKGDKKAMYVSLGNLVRTVNPVLGEHGLSASWEISQGDKLVKVSCKLSHRLGHSEIVTMEAPPDISGGAAKNPIQQIKSTVTYLRAATFEAVTGLAATDEANLDDDGNAGTSEINLLEQWEIRCEEAGAAARSVDEIAKWWKDNSPAIKKELSKANAAKIFEVVVTHKNRLKVPERQPGDEQEG